MQVGKKLVQVLESKVFALTTENHALITEIHTLKLTIAALEEKLGLNSKNSSIPTSKELYKIKNNNRPKSSRNIGAQPGHKGNFRSNGTPDEVIEVILPRFCECGGEINLSAEPHIHQKVDIPDIKPYVTEYRMQRGRCRKCGKRKSSALPDGVTADTFGPRTKAIIGSLTAFYKNSKKEVANILNDIFNLNISVGSISNSEARVSEKCKDAYEQVEVEVSNSEIVHMDETSHYRKGLMRWCWVFSSNIATFFKVGERRNKKVLADSVFGSDDDMVVVSDRYAAYNYFAADIRQICWAHLARDFERFAGSKNTEVQMFGCYLKSISSELFYLKKTLLDEVPEALAIAGPVIDIVATDSAVENDVAVNAVEDTVIEEDAIDSITAGNSEAEGDVVIMAVTVPVVESDTTEVAATDSTVIKGKGQRALNILRFARRAKKLRKRANYYLKQIAYGDMVHASRIAKNILKCEKMMWKFLEDPGKIPLTNNHAERQIRRYVLYRKNSYFTQSERGDRFLERVISLGTTWTQQGLNPFQNLMSLVSDPSA